MRVGIVNYDPLWMGGQNYYRNLLAALKKHPNPSVEPVIFCGFKSAAKTRCDFPDSTVIESSAIDRLGPSWFLSRVAASLGHPNPLVTRLLEKNGVSVLSHSLFVGSPYLKGIKRIDWIPDFQHLHFPRFYASPRVVAAQNACFQERCSSCDTLILSSQAAKSDLLSFSPQQAHKAAVLQFVSSPSSPSSIPSAGELQKKYCFEGPFFLLPNQFWAHKNHRLAIAALQILHKRGQRALILATGLTTDSRNPNFFSELTKFAAECNVLSSFRVLGQIPYNDLLGLMRNTVSFVNPSLFEGWSTSVEEAKSLGKTVLLSDIPVHREQAPELGLYFQPDSPESLADALWTTLNAYDHQADSLNQQRASQALPKRQLQFAERYQQIVLQTAAA